MKAVYMKKLILLLVVGLIATTMFSQEKIITGRIYDTEGNPLLGVWVYSDTSACMTSSDCYGAFHFLIRDVVDQVLYFNCFGYEKVVIEDLDTVKKSLIVRMKPGEGESGHPSPHYSYPNDFYDYFGLYMALQIDFQFNDYNEFRGILGYENISYMNKSNGILSMEIGASYKKHYLGVNFGWMSDESEENDSINIEFNTTQYGIHYGYNIIGTKLLLVTPKASVKWNRYRLLNTTNERRIPLEEYVDKKSLDLRINQMTASLGLNVMFKVLRGVPDNDDSGYLAVGLYGGYVFNLNSKPWVFSTRNRLLSDASIRIEPWYFGIQFSYNFQNF